VTHLTIGVTRSRVAGCLLATSTETLVPTANCRGNAKRTGAAVGTPPSRLSSPGVGAHGPPSLRAWMSPWPDTDLAMFW
jgi:hypothetical protein